MPCFTQQTSVVQFGPQTDPALLKKALEGLGFDVVMSKEKHLTFYQSSMGRSGTFIDGTLTVSSNMQEDMNVFKRAYSVEVVRSASARFGWGVKQSAPNTFQVTRRS